MKTDQLLRKILLGPYLYHQCNSGYISKDDLDKRIKSIKEMFHLDNDIDIDQLISLCNLKSNSISSINLLIN